MTLGRVPVPQTGPGQDDSGGDKVASSEGGKSSAAFFFVYAIAFDQDTFGVFSTRQAAEDSLRQQVKDGGPAWDGCEVQKWRIMGAAESGCGCLDREHPCCVVGNGLDYGRTCCDDCENRKAESVPVPQAASPPPESGSIAALEGRVRELEAALRDTVGWCGDLITDYSPGPVPMEHILHRERKLRVLVGAVLEPWGSGSGSARGASGTDAETPA